MATVLGLDAKAFRGPAGEKATVEMKNIKDLSLSLESGDADITTRKAAGWRMSVATLKEASIEFEMLYDTEDEDFKAISGAYFNNTPLALFILDGSGSGLDCDVSITGLSMEQALEEAISVSVTAKPTNIGGEKGRAPAWVTGTTSSE